MAGLGMPSIFSKSAVRMRVMVDLMIALIFAGSFWVDKGNSEAVWDLRLPPFETILVTLATVLNKEVTMGVEPYERRKRVIQKITCSC